METQEPWSEQEMLRNRLRLWRGFAACGLPLGLLGAVLLLLDLGDPDVRMLLLTLGTGINTAGWVVGSWLYPRPLGR